MNKSVTLESKQSRSKCKPDAVTLEHHKRIQLQPECTVEHTLEVIGGK